MVAAALMMADQKGKRYMRNGIETSIKVKRIDVCDLMMACTLAKEAANDGGRKWDKLHDQLKSKLDELDRQIDEI